MRCPAKSAYYGVTKTGAVVVPVDAMLTPDEVIYIIKDCGATALITGLAASAGAACARVGLCGGLYALLPQA